ncbi:MAG: YceI family protein [Gemmatimonadaceae bacterium]
MKRIYVGLFAVLPVIACSGSGPQTAFAASGRPQKSEVAEASSAATLRFVLSPTGSAARYRVRERLMGHDFPNDAVGETKSLTGAIEFDANGKVIPASSKFTLDAATFVSDQNRRDGYVRNRVLEADEYPSIVVVPTDVRGVKLPLPTSGTLPIEMTGNLTVHGVTRPTTWKGSATFTNGGVTGSAATMFTFNDIQMEQPHVPVLLSVADTIRLEMDFNLVRQ